MLTLLDPPHYKPQSIRPDSSCHYYFATTDQGHTANAYAAQFEDTNFIEDKVCTNDPSAGSMSDGIRHDGSLAYCTYSLETTNGDYDNLTTLVLVHPRESMSYPLTLVLNEYWNEANAFDISQSELERRALAIARAADKPSSRLSSGDS